LPERHHPSRNSVLVPSGNRAIIVFVTLVANNRQPVLASQAVQNCLLSAWAMADNWIVGRYIIMPDHIHLFCSPTRWPITSFQKWISYWKSLVARSFPDAHAIPLWQRDCWDTQLRSGDSYSAKWAYVRNNPVRKGLVQHADQWPFQGELNALSWHDR
jgi:putative transposase